VREVKALVAAGDAAGARDRFGELIGLLHGQQPAKPWLDAQRRSIQERLEAGVRPHGRVIAFPRDTALPGVARPRSALRSRLAAVAALLALVSAAGAAEAPAGR
jgi:hypothetical protein